MASTTSKLVWISVEEVDLSLTHDEIYMKLPESYRIIGYLEKFLELPSEILILIFSNTPSILLHSHKVSKDISKMCDTNFYQLVSTFPISEWEIRREMKLGIIMLDDNGYNCATIGKYQLKNEEFLVREIESCDFTSGLFDFEAAANWMTEDCDTKNFFDDITPAMFGEYKILQQRLNCMRHNPQYANQRLVDRWKKDKLASIKDITNLGDAVLFLVVNYAAIETLSCSDAAAGLSEASSNPVKMFSDVLNLNRPNSNREKRAELLLIRCNEIIDAEVTRLTCLP